MKKLFLSIISSSVLLLGQTQTFPPSAGSSSTSVPALQEPYVVGATPVVANTFVKPDGSNPSKVIPCTITDTTCLGVAVTSVSTGGTVVVQIRGPIQVFADNAVTAGHSAVMPTTTNGYAKDSGTAFSSTSSSFVGVFLASASSGSLVQIDVFGSTGGSGGLTINSTAISGSSTGAMLYSDGTLLQNNAHAIYTPTGLTFPTNSAASAPVVSLTGAIFTGGTATTTKPMLLIEPTGTTSNNWSTNGTMIGANAAPGFTGNFLDFELASGGAGVAKLSYVGNLTIAGAMNVLAVGGYQAASGAFFFWNNRSELTSPADGNILLHNHAETGFGLLQLGGTTSSFGAIGITNQTNPQVLIVDATGSGTADLVIGNQKATTGQRYLCIDTSGKLVSSASACSGT